MVRARARLVLDHPFFGHLALRMKLVEDHNCDTAWSDGKVIAYNPHYAQVLPGEKCKGLLGHLVMHPACRHHLRRNGRDPKQWNMACDYAINWILLNAGLTLPDGYLDDPQLHGKNADEIYARLFEDRTGDRFSDPDHQHEQQGKPDGERVDPQESVSRAGRMDDSSQEDEQRDDSNSTAADNEPQTSKDRQADSSDPGGSGEVRDASPSDSSESGMGRGVDEETEWRVNLAQAVAQARSMGDLPGGLARFVQDLLCPRLDWRRLLNRFIQASARHDYTWTPPNRRYVHQGLYLPGMRSDDLPEVVVALDTSGSISARELDQFAAELSAILETAAMSVHLLYCDMKVARAERVQCEDLPLTLAPVGGGGTDFRPAFEWVEQQGLQPRCMIYLTDMACNRFPKEPSYPVLWACLGDEEISPPFGESIAVM